MPTENRRIATYFPKDIDDKFNAFKLSRGIRGDSQALLTIVSEFLGVTQEVAHLSSPDLLSRFETLEKVVFKIQQQLGQAQSVPMFPDTQESKISLIPTGQLNLLETIHSVESIPIVVAPNFSNHLDVPSSADGKRFLTLKQAYPIAKYRGYANQLGTFKEWARKNPEECFRLYSLYRLKTINALRGTPIFEDVTYVSELDCQDF